MTALANRSKVVLDHPTYDLRASQVPTPLPIVQFFWKLVAKHRPTLGTVLDMGAGDGRFARFGHYKTYKGIEIDETRIIAARPRRNAHITNGCVFAAKPELADACIGNPPYLRHQDIESPWKEETLRRLSDELDIELSGHGNLFLYFMALGLLRTKAEGLLALVIPFDWVSRPAARNLRQYIERKRWRVTVYRFSFGVFESVDTTASVSIIDKSRRSSNWHFFDVDSQLRVLPRKGLTGTGLAPLSYSRRGRLFARRGLAPGNQRVFTLTEGERIHHGLHASDVAPCVTSLRGVEQFSTLDADSFRTHFVEAGRRCWLVKTEGELSPRVQRYLDSVPLEDRSTATCLRQKPWYRYEKVEVPGLLLHSAFTSDEGPKALVNMIGAVPVGSIYGIYGCTQGKEAKLRDRLLAKRLIRRVVPHSRKLRKLEIGQVNELLTELSTVIDE